MQSKIHVAIMISYVPPIVKFEVSCYLVWLITQVILHSNVESHFLYEYAHSCCYLVNGITFKMKGLIYDQILDFFLHHIQLAL